MAASQQAKSLTVSAEQIRGVTYAEEVEIVERVLNERGKLTAKQLYFLIHSRLMRSLEPWARENGVPLVDVIRLLDDDRSRLVSWVHLNPEANGIIADGLAGPILERTCPGAAMAVAGP